MSLVFDMAKSHFTREAALSARFEWDEWKTTYYFYFVDPDQAAQLGPLSDPAIAAFALAVTEWVCARFWPDPGAAKVLQFIDAAWIQQLKVGNCEQIEFDQAAWQGSIRGPLRYAQLIAADTIFDGAEDGDRVARACWASNLALHVIHESEREQFKAWMSECLERLAQFHPYEILEPASIFDDYPEPDQVAPAVLRPDLPYDPADTQRYVREHMARISATNPYVSFD